MSEPREIPREINVSGLTDLPFDHHSNIWWGTLGFVLIEGFTLVLMGAAYFYLRMNELEWPPGRTPLPDLLIPTVNTILLLLIIVPMRAVDKAARRFDKAGVIRGLVIAAAMTLVVGVLRWFELKALNVSYDAHAYGSVSWGLVLLHSTLIFVDFWETVVFAAILMSGRGMMKHYSDAADAAFYQYFLSTVYVPIYIIVYWGPRIF
jgi:cytochrome c oxidase subunit III